MMAPVMDRSLRMFNPGQELLKRIHSGQGHVVFLGSHCAGCKVLGRDHVESVTDKKDSNPFHYYKVNSYT